MLTDDKKDITLRLMTSGEIAMAKKIYKNSIQYNKVWIHKGSYLPFGLQKKNTAMTPNGEMYFRDAYSSDFSNTTIRIKHIFIHELGHVWQYQKGMNIKTRGLLSWAVDYGYELGDHSLGHYGMEQQAQIIADYYLLTLPNGRNNWDTLSYCKNGHELSNDELLRKYRYILMAL